MTLNLVLFTLSIVLFDVTLGTNNDPDSSQGHSSVDNPWRDWQTPYVHEEHDVVRRSVRTGSRTADTASGSVREDELYTEEATSGSNDRHQRRHRNRNRNQQTPEPQTNRRTSSEPEYYNEEYSDSEFGMLNDGGELPDENCTSYCALRQASRDYRLEQIRVEILAKLRLQSPPNITDKRLPQYPEIDEWLRNFPETPSDEDSLDPVVKIISMIIIAHPPPPEKRLPNMEHVCFFEFQSDVEAMDIVSAKLGVFVRKVENPTNTITMFLVYKVKPRRRGNILVKRRRITLNSEGTNTWYRFDMDSVVKGWVRNPTTNFGIQIMVFDDNGRSLAIVDPENEEEKLYKPYIDIRLTTRPKKSARDKRMISQDCDDETTSTPACCRYPMIVHFAWFGWDWILAPKTIQAHYCSGECNTRIGSVATHLAKQAKVEAYTSCCVPNKFDVLKMLYYSNRERIQFGVVKGVIVDSCGCV